MKCFYKLPENMSDDLINYRDSVEEFLKGKIHPVQFRGIRVPMGIYEQRTSNTFMVRIRIPAGGVTPGQMICISELGKKYSPEMLHITTRQDIQIHKVKLEDTPDILEYLVKAGLTSKGGGGNTVRNITACCDSGVCKDEIFDTSPYAIALTEHMIKDSRSYTLPRKFKVAFSGCGKDCSLATINDVGFIAVIKEINGKKVNGFKVYVAGGMGNNSKVAQELEEFIPSEDVADVCEAVKRLFDKNGNRRNKNNARLRFLFSKLGRDEFIRLYKLELNSIKKDGGTKLELKELPLSSPLKKDKKDGEINRNDGFDLKKYNRWRKQETNSQRQNGFSTVKVRLPLGDISIDNMISLAGLAVEYGEGTLRSTHDQNFMFRWVDENDLEELFINLDNLGHISDKAAVNDIVCCTGASTCRLGICLSRGMAESISENFEKQKDKLSKIDDLKIMISGCPNSCGQHPVGKIGLFGGARRIEDRLAPHYMISLGGRAEEGKAVLGENMGLAHVKNIPLILSDFLINYADNLEKLSDFYSYVDKKGKTLMASLIEEYSRVSTYEEDKSYFFDCGAEKEFSLAGRGVAECGAGVFDMIEVDLEESKKAFENSLKADNPAAHLYLAINRSCRALLVTKGMDAQSDIEAFEHFEKEFINSGLIESKFVKLMFLATEYSKGNLRDEAINNSAAFIKDLVFTVKALYDGMDDSLQFKKSYGGEKEAEEASNKVTKDIEVAETELFDLRNVKCPFNYVKAKLKLETMNVEDELEIYLDEGEPIINVPNSLKNDGQEILSSEKVDDGYYRLLIKKKK